MKLQKNLKFHQQPIYPINKNSATNSQHCRIRVTRTERKAINWETKSEKRICFWAEK